MLPIEALAFERHSIPRVSFRKTSESSSNNPRDCASGLHCGVLCFAGEIYVHRATALRLRWYFDAHWGAGFDRSSMPSGLLGFEDDLKILPSTPLRHKKGMSSPFLTHTSIDFVTIRKR